MRIKNEVAKVELLSDAAEEFIAFKIAEQIGERTLKDYRKELSKFIAASSNQFSKDELIHDLTLYFAALPSTSAAVYNRPYSCLNAFFEWCVLRDKLDYNPLKKAGLHKKKDDSEIHAADINDIKKLLEACDKRTFTGHRNAVIISLMLDTGIRTSELVRLRKEDYNHNTKTIWIKAEICKTKKSREIYLSPTVATMLFKYLKTLPKEIELMFPSRDCNMLNSNELAREFRKLCEKAEVKITPYQLRHSFATYFIENGGNVFVLQNLMGHSDISMTKRYTDISKEQKQEQHFNFSPTTLLEKKTRIA